MKQISRIWYTKSQKAVMWEHWSKGDSLQQIAQLFDRNTPQYRAFGENTKLESTVRYLGIEVDDALVMAE